MNPATPSVHSTLASLARLTAREVARWTAGMMALSVVLQVIVGGEEGIMGLLANQEPLCSQWPRVQASRESIEAFTRLNGQRLPVRETKQLSRDLPIRDKTWIPATGRIHGVDVLVAVTPRNSAGEGLSDEFLIAASGSEAGEGKGKQGEVLHGLSLS